MASQLETPRSRRAVLLAAVGAAVGTLTAAVGRSSTARAADGDAVLLGATNTAASTTVLALPSSLADPVRPPSPALRVESAGDGLAVAIEAHSREEYAIVADSIMGGVLGLSVNGYGVAGQSDNDVGVLGTSGVAVGVQGESTSGTGGFFRSKSGTALEVSGLARMSRSGRATVMAGRASVDIDLRAKGGLAGTPLCFANLMTYRQGTFVTAVRPNYPVSGKARIYLNRAVTGSTNVAWVVLNPPVPPTPPDPNGP
jgi:hypothetical protein